MTREFDCIECGRHVALFGSVPWKANLCLICMHMPGWFRDPKLRKIIAPDMTLADAPLHERETER